MRIHEAWHAGPAVAVLIVLSGLAAGCASYETGFFRYESEVRAPRGAGARVEVFGGTPERPFREIGEVFAAGGSLESLDGLRAALIEKAAAVGAEAVVRVRVQPSLETYAECGPGVAVWGMDFGGYGGYGWSGPAGWYGPSGRSRVVVRGVAVVWTGKDASAGEIETR